MLSLMFGFALSATQIPGKLKDNLVMMHPSFRLVDICSVFIIILLFNRARIKLYYLFNIHSRHATLSKDAEFFAHELHIDWKLALMQCT